MAITVADIVARIRSEGADKVISDLGRTGVATDNLEKKTGNVSKAMVTHGKRMTAGITLPVAGMAVAFVNSASDQNEAFSALNTVYGVNSEQSKALLENARNAAGAVGLSATEYAQAATQ